MTKSDLKIEKITGQPDEKFATSVFFKKIEISEDESGTLTAGILLANAVFEDVQTTLHDIFAIAVSKIEAGGESYLDLLKEAVLAGGDYLDGRDLEGSFVFCFFINGICYIAKYKKDVKIWIYKFEKSKQIEFESGSGPYVAGDIFVIGTDKFFSTYETNVLSSTADIELDDFIDELATEVSADSEQSKLSAIFVQVKGERSGEVQVVQKEDQQTPVVGTVDDEKKADEAVEVKAEPETYKKPKTNPVSTLLSGVIRELSRIRRGELGAIFRLRRSLVVIAIVMLFVIGVSVFMTIKSQGDSKNRALFDSYFSEAQTSYSEAVAILEQNKLRAREILGEAQKKVDEALGVFPNNAEALKLKNDISARLKETEALSNLNFKTVLDINNPVSLMVGGDNIVVTDDNKIYEIDSEGDVSRETEVQNSVFDSAFYDGAVFNTTNNKIYKIKLGKDVEEELTDAEKGIDIGVFIGNIYVLGTNQIFKYTPTADGYVKSADYLEKPESFGNDSRFAIDGSIWVTNGANVEKFTRGKKDDFTLSGVPSGAKLSDIYTSADIDNIYVVDRTSKSVLVFSKDGIYKNSFQSSEIGKSRGIAVDKEESKLYVISDSKLLEAAIKSENP